MRELEYPFNAEEIIKKKKAYKKQLLAENGAKCVEKKIAILGGQTTQNIKLILELFLLNQGIKPVFYESEYNMYYEDGMFPNPALEEFAPDLIYVCTCIRNISVFPQMSDDRDAVEMKKKQVVDHFAGLWDSLREKYHCPIIQNNFEILKDLLETNQYHAALLSRIESKIDNNLWCPILKREVNP